MCEVAASGNRFFSCNTQGLPLQDGGGSAGGAAAAHRCGGIPVPQSGEHSRVTTWKYRVRDTVVADSAS